MNRIETTVFVDDAHRATIELPADISPGAHRIGIYTAIFAATPWGDGSRRSGADLHRCRSYLSIRGRPRLQSLVSQGLRIRHPLVTSEGRHSRSVPSSCQ